MQRSPADSSPPGATASRPLRVLLIGSRPPPIGGTTVSFQQLARELAELPDVAVEVVDARPRAAEPLAKVVWALSNAFNVLRAARRAEVVTFHASTPGVVWIAPILLAVCRILGRPFLLRVFGGSLDGEYGEMSSLARWLLRLAFRADRVLLQTHGLVRFFSAEFPSAHVEWYSNSRPLPTEPASSLEPKEPEHGRFVFVGHVKASKGLREILTAADQIPECRVDVYGPLHDGFSEHDFRGNTRVTYRGELPPEEVVPTLRHCEALLLPTWHFGEGYPGIILEAYTAGCPVLATRWRAIPEIVEDGVSGLLVEPRSADDLARAMRELMSSPEERARLAEGARQAARRFASTVWTAQFASVCFEVARRGRPA